MAARVRAERERRLKRFGRRFKWRCVACGEYVRSIRFHIWRKRTRIRR